MSFAVRSATVRYADTLALDDVSVAVEPGSVVWGAGGSSGFIAPDHRACDA